jgi:hypothetical protein
MMMGTLDIASHQHIDPPISYSSLGIDVSVYLHGTVGADNTAATLYLGPINVDTAPFSYELNNQAGLTFWAFMSGAPPIAAAFSNMPDAMPCRYVPCFLTSSTLYEQPGPINTTIDIQASLLLFQNEGGGLVVGDPAFGMTLVTPDSIAINPIPDTLPLLASGLALIALFGWLRKRKAAAVVG